LAQLEARGPDFATGIFVAEVIVMSSLSRRPGSRLQICGFLGAGLDDYWCVVACNFRQANAKDAGAFLT
jgi:hypothetical protein